MTIRTGTKEVKKNYQPARMSPKGHKFREETSKK